ncbi:hypothetical protein ABRY23_01630 [Melioribacteraceae bacterium 4301-Me]|uniref:hypothetical protein n=1 Tax=Pyranulibacter aquaticus TaxID=3163344 RepID=UPI0035974B8D
MLIRFIVWSIIFYFFFKLIKNVIKYFADEQKLNTSKRYEFTTQQNNPTSGYKVKKEDIIDAEFEELDNNKKK